ncbi:type I-E CRISPR-associated protein Cas6/Cse3/CasE [Hoyosella sp. YIM 151337]|uniref:type I-E CRISPR-associated protein Cas6/Cse3/CasE n=1 Tax=Hoyosella sp. YIM 151337 TaxID=2992742 RepID=UPI0022361E40|nr:type I-E CRISPR-associated protein Cas6/Cse3/CasE [Hoyosella sp. YIM 151337]MCW4353529.1 type I-E CRISPR-associated protein Cas6/Cse3/CasE [Hoyosella sp. YIM 151337]
MSHLLRWEVCELYLTRMPLNTRRRGAMKLLTSPQSMHAAVQSAFPPSSLERAGGRSLWRVDQTSDSLTALYLVSPIEPDLSHVAEQAGWQVGDMWQTRDYRPLLDRLAKGQMWGFKLRANPVFHGTKADKGWADTKPLAHVTVRQQEEWLVRRAETCGFALTSSEGTHATSRVTNRSTLRFLKSGHRVVIATATYDGVLTVQDPQALRRTLTEGLGRAKAYGCGLLTLAPLPIGAPG